MSNEKGVVLWQGKSLLNDKDIVAIATLKSDNRKTGDMIQVWILPCDISPSTARATGNDQSICGNCPIKSNCYVVAAQAPNAVWKSWKNNKYSNDLSILKSGKYKDKPIRWGAIGEAVLIPIKIIEDLSEGRKTKGYTHLWSLLNYYYESPIVERYKKYFMASVESEVDAIRAQSLGWKTFRILENTNIKLIENEIHCLASKEGGMITQCKKCGNCSGNKSRNVVILDHGPKTRMKKRVENVIS